MIADMLLLKTANSLSNTSILIMMDILTTLSKHKPGLKQHLYRFMQVMLPCDDMYLRSAATQRPNYPIKSYERLPHIVEKELSILFEKYISKLSNI